MLVSHTSAQKLRFENIKGKYLFDKKVFRFTFAKRILPSPLTICAPLEYVNEALGTSCFENFGCDIGSGQVSTSGIRIINYPTRHSPCNIKIKFSSQNNEFQCHVHLYLHQAIVEGADPNRTPTVSEFSCLDIKHVRSLLRGLSHNVFLTTFFTQRLSHIVFLTPLPLHIRPHNVVLTTSRYLGYFFGCINTYPKINQIRLSSDPRNFDNFWSIKLKCRRCTSAIFLHYAKFQNPTTKASYQSVAEKVLYKYPKISSYSCKFRPPVISKICRRSN